MTNPRVVSGQAFGRLTAIEKVGTDKWGSPRWLCACSCGREHVVAAGNLKGGQIRSCGCARREATIVNGRRNRRHGDWKAVEYRAWGGMLSRCRNSRNPSYPNYGGRGISVCARWLVYENFIADVGRRPSAGHSIDRINVNGNYEPGNVRWATVGEQNRNRTDNHFVEFRGERLTLSQWSARSGICDKLIAYRLKHGWAVADALTKAPRTWA